MKPHSFGRPGEHRSPVRALRVLIVVAALVGAPHSTAAQSPTPTPADTWGPSCTDSSYGNAIKACYTGADHGKFCCRDADCNNRHCQRQAHNKVCAGVRRCAKRGTVCLTNADCLPAWATDRDDFCTLGTGTFLYPYRGCTQNNDCGLCTSAAQLNWPCTSDSQCGGRTGTCNKSAPDAACIPGISQSELGGPSFIDPTTGNGYPGDTIPDFRIGGSGLGGEAGRPLIRHDGQAPHARVWYDP